MVTTDEISRARAGDGDAFEQLTEPHWRELRVHCYRMLGSMQDAEDALQETLLAAWRSFGGFQGHASLRTWLYRITTNTCLNALSHGQPPAPKEWDVPNVEPPAPTRLGEVLWLEPYPDALLEGALGVPHGPEARYDQKESISLAFVTALQVLPPRQVAVLILRDVLGFRASEVADMLDSTVESVTSALKRARAGLQHRWPPAADPASRPDIDAVAEDAIVAKFVRGMGVRRSRRLDRPVDRRRLHLDATDAFRVRGPRDRCPLLRQHLRRRQEVRPRADAGQRSTRVRSLPTHPQRRQPRGGSLRPHTRRRQHPRHDSLRERCAPIIRATATAPESVTAHRRWPSR